VGTDAPESLDWPAWIFVGGLGAGLLLQRLEPVQPRIPDAARAFVAARCAGPRSLLTDSAFELEALPGVGEVRALAIAQARWEARVAGRPLVLEDVPGIGPETARAIRAEYARLARDQP
jgi:transposase